MQALILSSLQLWLTISGSSEYTSKVKSLDSRAKPSVSNAASFSSTMDPHHQQITDLKLLPGRIRALLVSKAGCPRRLSAGVEGLRG